MKLGKKQTNGRGFGFIEFTDANGDACSIQESSSADRDALWIGCEHESKHHVTGELLGARMHLDKPRIVALIKILQGWLESGRL